MKYGENHPLYGQKLASSFTKENHPNAKPITINDVQYISIAEAARCLNITKDKL